MDKNILIGGDFGTNGLKLLAFDTAADHPVADSYRSYPVHVPGSNLAEHNPRDWWDAFVLGVAELRAGGVDLHRVAAIALSCHVPTLTPMDADGTLLGNGIIWADYRSAPQCRRLQAAHAQALYAVNPAQLRDHQMLCKMLWLKEERPDLYARTACFLQCSGYIAYRLTGRFSIDHGSAALFHTYNVYTARWDEEICRLVGIAPEKLPPIYHSDQVVGTILPEAAAETGLDPDTLVVAGAGDTAAAALGVGCTDEGDICFSAGTASSMVTVYDCSKHPFRTDPRLLTIGHTLSGKMLNVAVMACTGAALKWARNALGEPEDALAAKQGASVFDLLCSQAAQADPGAGGLLFFPYILGELSPYFNPDARGVFLGISETTRKSHLLRAILEGTCYGFRQNLTILEELGAFSRRGEIIATGGPASSPLWMQILADVSGLQVSVLENALGAPFGDIILAGVAAGIYPDQAQAARAHIHYTRTFRPDDRNRDVYDRMFRAYTQIAPRLQDDFSLLAQSKA